MVYCSTKHKNTENLIKSLKDKENITYLDITNELNYDFDKLNEFQIIDFTSKIFMSKHTKFDITDNYNYRLMSKNLELSRK